MRGPYPCLRMGLIALGFWSLTFDTLLGAEPAAKQQPDAILAGSTPPPTGWQLVQKITVPTNQAANFSKKLGGQVLGLTNSIFDHEGERLQINAVICESEKEAKKVQNKLQVLHNNNPAFALQRQHVAYEFIGSYSKVMLAHYQFGFKPSRVLYQVQFGVAPVTHCDHSQWNDLFNAFLNQERDPKPVTEMKIQQMAKHFQFGQTLTMSKWGLGREATHWQLTPQPSQQRDIPSESTIQFELTRLPTKVGIPTAMVRAKIVSEAFAFAPSETVQEPRFCSATEFWPSDDPEIQELAKRIVGTSTKPRQQVEKLLQWLTPGKNITYGGPLGCRCGVQTVLAQKQGRCWDFSDCFITLCRAVGLPARQVLGWYYERDGHVWAQVYIEGEGWWAVDPTAGLACTADYVPFFLSSTGTCPFIYTTAVSVTPVSEN